jgi:hypothetical protein
MNNKGQFSIIAALLVAVVLVASVVTTYSAVRYSQLQDQPQILSAVDETNLGLKQILGFTVGYYGSVLKVTGNMTYAQTLAQNYFKSGLDKIGQIRPEWGLSMSMTNLDLTTNWYSDSSYSQGTVNVNYNLTGLGISGVGYSTSIRLDVQVTNATSANKAQFKVLTDGNEPLINLGKTNLKFFKYDNETSAWNLAIPTNVVSYADGTYEIDLPPGVLDNAYVVQVEDTRGLMVLASSFTQFTTSLIWNSTAYGTDFDFVDDANLDVLGAHSNFAAQQYGPDEVYDTLTEEPLGTTYVSNYPTSYKLIESTTLTGGSLSNIQNNDGVYITFRSYTSGAEKRAQVEFTGTSTAPFDLIWTIDSIVSTSSVNATFQLYNFATGQYPVSGDGYVNTILGSSGPIINQSIITNPENFLNSSGNWKMMITAFKVTTYSFSLSIDQVQFTSDVTNYALSLQEQWLNVNASNLRQDLCVKTGTMGSEPLVVQILHDGSWQNLLTLAPNYFNNASLAPFIDSSTLTIRFVGSNDFADPTQSSWNIDAVFLKDQPDISFLLTQQQSSTMTLEVLQNGTIRWLGQNLQVTTQTLPIPPVPVRAIHVNQTINGVNQEVPFQIEDWASNYQIPLGLTSNTTLFSGRQMIVFLIDSKVTDFTIWWNGSDAATQTSLAFTNQYFTNDDPGTSTLSNGDITLLIGDFNVRATVGSTSSTANFMRINQQNSVYGAGEAYVIHHGIVRDIVQQESEWNNGPAGSPNLYANIVITLPAKATYYTYQLRIMFISSAQARAITDLSPIRLSTSLSSPTLQTENNTLAGFPILQNGTATYSNFASSGWTAHHFTQFITDTGKGAGIMFTNIANQKLYAFDSFPASTSKGAIKTSNGLLELLPVSQSQVQFTFPYDITWNGAVVTFDNTTPLCGLYSGTTPIGFWILAEYPPTLTVVPRS